MAELNPNEMDIQVIDFNKVCRTCLSCDGKMRNLFMEDDTEEIIEIRKMIEDITIYPVTKDDNLPNNICEKCIDHVQVAFQFKTHCERAYEILTSVMESYQTQLKESSSIIPTDLVFVEDDNEEEKEDQKTTIISDDHVETITGAVSITDHTQSGEEAENRCNICNKTFTQEVHLRKHMSAIHPNVEQLCTLCNKNCGSTTRLKKHIVLCHGSQTSEKEENVQEKPRCTECNEEFDTALAVARHVCDENKSTNQNTTVKTDLQYTESDSHPLFDYDDDSSNLYDAHENENSNDDPDMHAIDSGDENDGEDDDNNDEHDVDYNTQSGMEYDNDDNSFDDDKPLLELRQKKSGKNMKRRNSTRVCDGLPRKRGPKPKPRPEHKCVICNKTFSRGTHLRRHLLTHTAERPYVCKECDKRFARADHLRMHSFKHRVKPYACSFCGRGFMRSEHLSQHEKLRHTVGECNAKTEFCTICNKGFTTAKYLAIHMRIHTDRKWKCKFCPEVFDTKALSSQHAKTHVHEKPFLCSECGLRFVRNDYLIIHMRRHKGEKPYKCKFCSKGFPRATDLNVHERYHTGEKTHLCTVCGKGFQRAYNLLVHMRVHTGERPYKCPHCTKCFAQGNDLKSHIRRHTGERIKCEICEEGFIQGYHLTQHKRNVHGITVESNIRRVEKFVTPIEQLQQMETIRQKFVVQPKIEIQQIDADAREQENYEIEFYADIKSEEPMTSNGIC